MGSGTTRNVRDAFALLSPSLTFCLAMRRVLHLKMVTQCAMLEEFGIFLVLADKVWVLLA